MLQFFQHFLITKGFKKQFDGNIKAYHQKGNYTMNKVTDGEGRNGIKSQFRESRPVVAVFPKPDRLPEALPNEQTLPAEPSLSS